MSELANVRLFVLPAAAAVGLTAGVGLVATGRPLVGALALAAGLAAGVGAASVVFR